MTYFWVMELWVPVHSGAQYVTYTHELSSHEATKSAHIYPGGAQHKVQLDAVVGTSERIISTTDVVLGLWEIAPRLSCFLCHTVCFAIHLLQDIK